MPNLKAVLDTDPRTEADHIGYLRFQAPDGRIDVIMVTDGPTYELYPEREKYSRGPVWHIEIRDAEGKAQIQPCIQLKEGESMSLIVTPSIDVKDRYHTGSVVVFDLVQELPREAGA